MSNRPRVPEQVKRQLRQESYFGCCKCGCALIEYHHIIPWQEEKHFRPKDMMVLCPNCHAEIVTFPKNKQYEMKQEPYNKTNGNPMGQLYNHQKELSLEVMGNKFTNTPILIFMDDEPIIGLTKDNNGQVGINATIYGESDDLLVTIKNNEWCSYTDTVWDIIHRPNYLKVNSQSRKILLEVCLDRAPPALRGEFWKNKSCISFDEGFLRIGSRNVRGAKFRDCEIQAEVGIYYNSIEARVNIACTLEHVLQRTQEYQRTSKCPPL